MFRVKVLHLVHLQQHAGGGIIVLPSFLRCHWQYFSAVIDVVGMHLLAVNVCRNELNVKVRNSILSVEHQEWRSHQVLVGVTREYNLYLYVTGGEEESVHFHLVASSYASLSAMLTLPPQIGFGSAERIRRRRAVWASDGGVQEWKRCSPWRAVTAAEDETGWICYFQHHDRPSARLSTELETMWRYCLLRRETREENTSLIIPVTSWF